MREKVTKAARGQQGPGVLAGPGVLFDGTGALPVRRISDGGRDGTRTVIVNGEEEILIEKDEKKVVVYVGENKSARVRLVGKGAEAKVLGITVGSGGDSLEMDVRVVHESPETSAEIILCGVAYEESKVTIKGSVVIKKGARLASDTLKEDLLLVGEAAKGETYPFLEIEENDVTAKHAATVGRIDETQLFYLASRGIARTEAERMLVVAFLWPVLGEVPETERAMIEGRLRQPYE